MENKEKITEEMNEKLSQLKELEQTEALLKNNVNEFTFNKKLYRVHSPVSWEKAQCDKERTKKYTEFLNDPNYLFRKQMVIKLRENKGVDILVMEQEAFRLFKEEGDLLKKLSQTTIEPDISNLKNEIEAIRDLKNENFIERENLLKFCIEKQLEDFWKLYMIYVVLEVKNGEQWEKVYKTYEDFQNSTDDVLLGRAAQVLAYLIFHENL